MFEVYKTCPHEGRTQQLQMFDTLNLKILLMQEDSIFSNSLTKNHSIDKSVVESVAVHSPAL